jgi:hypothetical protein
MALTYDVSAKLINQRQWWTADGPAYRRYIARFGDPAGIVLQPEGPQGPRTEFGGDDGVVARRF